MNQEGSRASPAEFTRIDGVGPRMAESLVLAGIDSMAKLASMSVDDVVQALAEVGVTASANKVLSQHWHTQAWQLAQADDVLEQDDQPGDEPESDEPPNGWEEHAGFFVYFDRSEKKGDEEGGNEPEIRTPGGEPADERWRTRVWDTKAMAEYEMPGAALGPWLTFILGRADLPATVQAEDDAGFEVETASLEQRPTSAGSDTWLTAEIAVRVRDDAAFEAALGAALLQAALGD